MNAVHRIAALLARFRRWVSFRGVTSGVVVLGRERIRGEVFEPVDAAGSERLNGRIAERAALARQVTEACAIAGVAQLAGILLADAGMTIDAARDRIQEGRGAGGIEIKTAHAAGSTP